MTDVVERRILEQFLSELMDIQRRFANELKQAIEKAKGEVK